MNLRDITTKIISIGDGQYVNNAGSVDGEFISELARYEQQIQDHYIGLFPEKLKDNQSKFATGVDLRWNAGYNFAIDQMKSKIEGDK